MFQAPSQGRGRSAPEYAYYAPATHPSRGSVKDIRQSLSTGKGNGLVEPEVLKRMVERVLDPDHGMGYEPMICFHSSFCALVHLVGLDNAVA